MNSSRSSKGRLNARKRELLEHILQQEAAGEFNGQTIVPRTPGESIPLTYAQERIWFLDQINRDSSSFNIPTVISLEFPVKVPALEHALVDLVERHEALRTGIGVKDGKPVQIIASSVPITLSVQNLTHLPVAERICEAERIARNEIRVGFDFEQPPLLRARLLVISPYRSIFVLTIHHIIADGWSIDIIMREITILYRKHAGEGGVVLPELPIQYGDIAVWQRRWMQSSEMQEQLNYWKRQLTNMQTLDLPTDFARPPIQSFEGARQNIVLEPDEHAVLTDFCHRHDVTIFMGLLAVFQALLYRYTHQTDFSIGSPIAGRNRHEVESVVGLFLNTLVLRADLSGNISFRELLMRARETCIAAFANQDIPFEKIIEELQPKRDLSRTPLFQTFFNLLNYGQQTEAPAPQEHGPVAASARFDLSVYATEGYNWLELMLVYNTELFSDQSAESMLLSYRRLLAEAIANPDSPVASLPMMIQQDRKIVPRGQNDAFVKTPFVRFPKFSVEQSIAERFSAQAAACAARPAIVTTEETWTYDELDIHSTLVASALTECLGSSEGRIALFMKRDTWIIAGLLGALKAGKTYVPLSHSLPPERIKFILSDSEAEAVVTDLDTFDFAREVTDPSLPILRIEELLSGKSEYYPSRVLPDRLAYLIYTSGSLGKPKGVMQTHRNALKHIRNYTNSLHITELDRLTFLPPYGFDAAVMDLFGALLNGAALYRYDVREQGTLGLPRFLADHQITVYHSTPSVFRLLVTAMNGQENFQNLRLVVLGGEPVLRKDVEAFRAQFPQNSILINGYGPTESTLCLQYFIDNKTKMERARVPIGYPVEDTTVLLLDSGGNEVPPHVPGEIVIRSAHVALGYWRQEELTRTAFRSASPDGNERMYFTGDIGRRLSDGSIEFLNRRDQRVKVRGYRIELGEIENQLVQLPEIREAAVVSYEDGLAEVKLVAYLVGNKRSLDAPAVRTALLAKLPEYMVPSRFIWIDEIPVTINGKLDHSKLGDLSSLPAEIRSDLEESQTKTEKTLASIWMDLLKVAAIGRNDDFFINLGGHSLLATQLVSRLVQIFGTEIHLRTVFQNPTLSGLAAFIDAIPREAASRHDPPIVAVKRETRRIIIQPSGEIQVPEGTKLTGSNPSVLDTL